MCCLLATSLQAQNGFGSYLRDIIQKQEKGILVTAKLIEACGLCDSLDILMDYEYEKLYQTGRIPYSFSSTGGSYETFYTPEHRYYGYTLFAETDDFWEAALGKSYKAITVADVADYIQQHCNFTKQYGNDEDYSNPENVIYQFTTYHMLNRRLNANCLVNHYNERLYDINRKEPSVAVCEYYTTMGDRRLLRTFESAESNGVCLNRFPVLDNGRHGTYHELSCDPDKAGIAVDVSKAISTDIPNAVIYPIDQLLAFDQATAQNMGKIRLRMDVASLFPEMATNDIRLSEIIDERHKNVYLPNDVYPYLEDLTVNIDTRFLYWTGRGNGWSNMQGDEFSVRGRQDFTLRLPSVPTNGTYELRMAVQTGGNRRGILQPYFGTDPDNLRPLGMPIDFRQAGDNTLHTNNSNTPSNIGYEMDTDDDYYNQMRDNELRENRYMKGCNQYVAGAPGNSNTMRSSNFCLRIILGSQTLDPNKTYYIRFKSVLDDETRQFYMDYIEFCPESVYDNPNEPEDIW
jgi:hypothetical protein